MVPALRAVTTRVSIPIALTVATSASAISTRANGRVVVITMLRPALRRSRPSSRGI